MSLIIEVTRRCNMRCAHCMRGDAQDIDVSLDRVDEIFSRIHPERGLHKLFLTGGEPSMVPGILEGIAKRISFPVGMIEFTSNGKDWGAEFLGSLWWLSVKCGILAINISKDQYHEPVDLDTESLRSMIPPSAMIRMYDVGMPYDIGRARELPDNTVPRDSWLPLLPTLLATGDTGLGDGLWEFTDSLLPCEDHEWYGDVLWHGEEHFLGIRALYSDKIVDCWDIRSGNLYADPSIRSLEEATKIAFHPYGIKLQE